MVPVLLLGELGKKYGRKFVLDIKSPAEAIRALVANFPDIEKYMSDKYYRVVVGKSDTTAEELHNPIGQQTIKIVPVISGAGGKWGGILLGAALIGLAFVPGMQGFVIAGAGSLGAGSAAITAASIAFSVGVSMVLGGIAQMLAPTPEAGSPKEPTENDPSYLFNGPVNTTAQGQPVAVGYGRLRVGSAVISAGIVAEQVAI